jgi:hypothetical protein
MVFRRYRPPAPCEAGFILSCAPFASRVPSRVHLPVRVSAAGASRGVLSLITTSARGVHSPAGIPGPPTFRPQRFTRSRRFAPPPALRACFIALPCPGFSLQGFVPRSSRITSSVTDTLAPLVPPPAGCPAPANVTSTSGSCSRPWSVMSSGRVRSVRIPGPSCVFNSLRLVARGPWERLRAPSARGLHETGLRVPRLADPQRIDRSSCCCLCPQRLFLSELSGLRVGCPSREAHRCRRPLSRPPTENLYSSRRATSIARPSSRIARVRTRVRCRRG